MRLHWLKIDRPCILEVPQLKDYAGQALIFRPPSLQTRCVTDDVFNHPLVKAYRDQLLLVEVEGNHAVLQPAAAPGEPAVYETVVKEVVDVIPMAEITPPPVVVPEPEVPVVPDVPATPAPEPEATPATPEDSAEESTVKDGDDKGFEVKRRRR